MRGTTRIIAVIAFLFALSSSTLSADVRKVIYVDYQPIDWVDPSVTTNAIVDMGYNVINLAFWLYDHPADFVQVWGAAETRMKQAAIDYAHSKGAVILVSCAGSTETPFDRDPADYGTKVGQWAANNLLDGIDFDLENFEAGFVAPGKSSQATIDWIVTANNAARSAFAAIRKTQPIISHAPQGPYFGRVGDTSSWAGALGGYTAVEKNAKVDFYNVQFYNQGATCYTSYESLFIRSVAGCPVFPGTSISEINQAGVPMNKIILGKPLRPEDAGNGFTTASTLKTMISLAQTNLKWNAGVMFWMFRANDQAGARDMIKNMFTSSSSSTTAAPAPSTTTSPTSTSSTSSSSTTASPTSSTSTSTSTTGSASQPTNCVYGTTQCKGTPESALASQCCTPGASCFNNGSFGVCCGPSTVGCVYGSDSSKKSACCDSRYTTCDSTRGCVDK